MWFWLPSDIAVLGVHPLLCTSDDLFCVYIDDLYLYTRVGDSLALGGTMLTLETWHQLTVRYDAESK